MAAAVGRCCKVLLGHVGCSNVQARNCHVGIDLLLVATCHALHHVQQGLCMVVCLQSFLVRAPLEEVIAPPPVRQLHGQAPQGQ
jgi:hypothetical protein